MGTGGKVHLGQGDGEKGRRREQVREFRPDEYRKGGPGEGSVPLAFTAGRPARAQASGECCLISWAQEPGRRCMEHLTCLRVVPGRHRQGPAGRVQRLPVRSAGTGRRGQGGQCSGLSIWQGVLTAASEPGAHLHVIHVNTRSIPSPLQGTPRSSQSSCYCAESL